MEIQLAALRQGLLNEQSVSPLSLSAGVGKKARKREKEIRLKKHCPSKYSGRFKKVCPASPQLISGAERTLRTCEPEIGGSTAGGFFQQAHNQKTGMTQPLPRHQEIHEILAKKIIRDLSDH